MYVRYYLALLLVCCNFALSSQQLDATATISHCTVAGATDGSITVTASGGTAPYNYKIGGGSWQASSTISSLDDGDYSVWVKDNNGDSIQVGLSANLVDNGGAEAGDQSSWTVTNGGSGWATSGTSRSGSYSWIGSYEWGTMTQTIDLVSEGYSTTYLDGAPEINFSEWYKGQLTNYSDYYYCVVTLQDASYGTISSQTNGSTSVSSSTSSWQETSFSFTGYGSGVRYVKIEHRSKDTEWWLGQYGTFIDDVRLTLDGETFTVLDGPDNVWTGTVSTDWNNTGNWSVSSVPTSSHDIEIPDVSGASGNFPVLGSGANGACNRITIESGASLTINDSYELEVHGDWSNSGTASVGSNGTVEFKGSTAQEISGSTTFGNVIINSSSTITHTSNLDIDGNITFSSGTLSSGGYSINIQGNWTSTGDHFTPGSGTITFDGTGNSSISGSSSSFEQNDIIFFDDFDASPESGWTSGATSGSNSWATGDPLGGRGDSGSGSADPTSDNTSGNSDNNVYGQGLGSGSGDGVGGYYDNSEEWLKTPSIDCSSYSSCSLSFYRFANFESSYDEAYVEVSNDNSNWTDLGHPTYPSDNSWTLVTYDISSIADGQSTVYIRWRSSSDFSVTYSGWNIDDVTITGNVTEAYVGETFEDLTINKTSGEINLSSKIFINDALTLTSGIINTTSSNILEIGPSGSVSSTSNSCHVNGPIIKRTNTTSKFTFPVGDGSVYRAAAITPSSTSPTSWTCQYFNAGYGDYTLTGANINHISSTEYWDINRSGSANSTIELTWDSNSGDIAQITELGVAHYNGTDWEDAGSNNHTGNTTAGTVESNSAWSSYSPFTLKSSTTNNSLPVDLVDFSVNCNDIGTEISWTTASELNNDYFILEYSENGSEFQTINTISGSGTTTDFNYYNYEHFESNEENFYRLTQVDYDGQFEVFSPIYVSCSVDVEPAITLSTNANGTYSFSVKGIDMSTAKVMLFDSQGRLIEELDSNEFSTTGWSKGVYYINIIDSNNLLSEKFAVNF